MTIQEEGNDFAANTGITSFSFTGGAANETVDLSDVIVNANSDSTTITATNLASDLDVTATLGDESAADTSAATLTVIGGTGSDSVTVTTDSAITSATDADGAYVVTTNVENVAIIAGAGGHFVDVAGVNGADISITNTANALFVENAHGNVVAAMGAAASTTNTNITVTANAAMNYTGADQNDLVTGSSSADSFAFAQVDLDGTGAGTAMGESISDADAIIGGAGADSMAADFVGDTNSAMNVDQVETIILSTTNGLTLDAANIGDDAVNTTTAGSVDLTISGTGSATVTNTNASIGTLDLSGLSAGATVTFDSADFGGTNAATRAIAVTASSASDTFIITGDNVANGAITITGFTAGSGIAADRLDFGALTDSNGVAYNSTSDLLFAQSGANTVITAKSSNGGESFTITLVDVAPDTLNQSTNFVFDETTSSEIVTTAAAFNINANTKTNASAFTTEGDDVIKTTAAHLVGSSLDASTEATDDTLVVLGGGALDMGDIAALANVEILTLEAATAITWDEAIGVTAASGITTINGSAGVDELILSNNEDVDFATGEVAFNDVETFTVDATVAGRTVTMISAQVESFDEFNFTGDGESSLVLTTATDTTTLDNVVFLADATITLGNVANNVTTVDALVGAGITITIEGNDSVDTIDVSDETGASFIINGGAGADDLTAGGGTDTFVFDEFDTADDITDFVSGTDHLVVDNVGDMGAGALRNVTLVNTTGTTATFNAVDAATSSKALAGTSGTLAANRLHGSATGAFAAVRAAVQADFVAAINDNKTATEGTIAGTAKAVANTHSSNMITLSAIAAASDGTGDRAIVSRFDLAAFAETSGGKLFLFRAENVGTDTVMGCTGATPVKVSDVITIQTITIATFGVDFGASDIFLL